MICLCLTFAFLSLLRMHFEISQLAFTKIETLLLNPVNTSDYSLETKITVMATKS